MKILTCNIRCFGAEDGPNNWIHRKELCIEVIRSQTPDIIGFNLGLIGFNWGRTRLFLVK